MCGAAAHLEAFDDAEQEEADYQQQALHCLGHQVKACLARRDGCNDGEDGRANEQA